MEMINHLNAAWFVSIALVINPCGIHRHPQVIVWQPGLNHKTTRDMWHSGVGWSVL
jgi:hypothetical protein